MEDGGKRKLGRELRRVLSKYGYMMPTDEMLGSLVFMLKDKFWYFRWVDIEIAIHAAANNQLNVDAADYGRPLPYSTMAKIFLGYRSRHDLFFQKRKQSFNNF